MEDKPKPRKLVMCAVAIQRANGRKQYQLAAKIGISETMLVKYLRGVRNLPAAKEAKLMRLLGLDKEAA